MLRPDEPKFATDLRHFMFWLGLLLAEWLFLNSVASVARRLVPAGATDASVYAGAAVIMLICWLIYLLPRTNFRWVLAVKYNEHLLRRLASLHGGRNEARVFRRLAGQLVHYLEPLVDLIALSADEGRPAVVCREHLVKRPFWGVWAYSIVLLFRGVTICHKDGHFRLVVDIRNQGYGIYNNAGKRFLGRRYAHTPEMEEASRWAIKAHEAVLRDDKNLLPPQWNSELEEWWKGIPLRWASAGVLPLVHFQKTQWIALLYRAGQDVYPHGWNIPNGASESKTEYKNISRLLQREFAEELLLVDGQPTPGATISYRAFTMQDAEDTSRYLVPTQLRRSLDQRLTQDHIMFEHKAGPALQPIPLPGRFELVMHTGLDPINWTKTVESKGEYAFAINPEEFGIELVKAYGFSMGPKQWLMDAEIHESGQLLRRPVLLLSVDYLRSLYIPGEGLACRPPLESPYYRGCKLLPDIPVGKYHYFDNPVDQAKRPAEIGHAMGEAAQGSTISDARAVSLCPVVWKSIEMLLAQPVSIPSAP